MFLIDFSNLYPYDFIIFLIKKKSLLFDVMLYSFKFEGGRENASTAAYV